MKIHHIVGKLKDSTMLVTDYACNSTMLARHLPLITYDMYLFIAVVYLDAKSLCQIKVVSSEVLVQSIF